MFKRWLLACLALTGLATFSIGVSSVHAADKPADATSGPAVTDSLGLLERAVARDSSKADNLYRLGVLYLDRDRIDEAVRVLTRANKVRPKHVPTMVNLGAALDAANQADHAQTLYRQALVISPDDTVANCRLASSLYAQTKYGEAVNLLRQLVALSPNSHCAYFTLGVAFADAGIYRDAIRMWKKVVELAPSSPEAVSSRESIDVLEKFLKGQ